ncbi:MAG: DUF2235 domain-containing protein [Acidobacteria bacterium]|nr:DUF2235 domain-containing protein [Acidobacteriota bacterium]
MSRRIAFCADGTWDGTGNNTNVWKISNAIASIPGQQFKFYDPGVGADGLPIEKLAGGAFGFGLFQKVKDGYSSIASLYEDGDDIFIFGFSRGAYTARSIAGMIGACGLPTKNPDPNQVEVAFEAYRNKDKRAEMLATLSAYDMVQPQIKMVGVWDTVGALGIPAVIGGVSPLLYGFLDTGLNPRILNAYHAVAIDEKREEFPATLWTTSPAPGQTISQVYFTGVHSDVGGGYADDPDTGTALSEITLGWMMCKAAALGLTIDPAMLAKYPCPTAAKNALDTKHESWNPIWLFPKPRKIDPKATLANSVAVRCQHDSSYRPCNVTLQSTGLPDAGYASEVVVA